MIIAVGGGSGAGKSTLIRRIIGRFDPGSAVVISMDHYYHDLSHLDPGERDERDFDHPDAIEHELLRVHLQQLAGGQAVDRPVYDFSSHTRQGTEVLEPAPLILLDGIFALSYADLNSLMDLRLFVDAAEDLRLQRRLNRDAGERGRDRESVLRQFRESVKPGHDRHVEPGRMVADLVISWGGDVGPVLDDLEARIRALIK